MKVRLRHGLWWIAVTIGFIPIVVASFGALVYDLLDKGYSRLRRWAWQELYIPKARRPGQP